MVHVKLVGLSLAGLFILIMGLVHLQKRRSKQFNDVAWDHDWDGGESFDEILGVHKVESSHQPDLFEAELTQGELVGKAKPICSELEIPDKLSEQLDEKVFILNLLPQGKPEFAGYELLQALLNAGLRFGEMDIFHRYEKNKDDADEIIFSIAQATEPGKFDIENMGETSTKGLALFIRLNGDQADVHNFETYVKSAIQLAQDLGGKLCDRSRQSLDEKLLQNLSKKLQEKRSY